MSGLPEEYRALARDIAKGSIVTQATARLIGRAVKPRLSSRGYKALLHLECSVLYLSTCLT